MATHRAAIITGTGATLVTNIGAALNNFGALYGTRLEVEFDASTNARLTDFTAANGQKLAYNKALRYLLYQIALSVNGATPFGPGT